jgi:hypothetical protein
MHAFMPAGRIQLCHLTGAHVIRPPSRLAQFFILDLPQQAKTQKKSSNRPLSPSFERCHPTKAAAPNVIAFPTLLKRDTR